MARLLEVRIVRIVNGCFLIEAGLSMAGEQQSTAGTLLRHGSSFSWNLPPSRFNDRALPRVVYIYIYRGLEKRCYLGVDAFSFPLVRGEPSRVIGQVDLTARAKRPDCKRFQTRLIAFILISFGIIGGAIRSRRL